MSNALEKKVITSAVNERKVIGKSLDESIEVAVSVLASVLSQEFKAEDLEIGVVSVSEPAFRVLGRSEIEAVLQRLAEKEA